MVVNFWRLVIISDVCGGKRSIRKLAEFHVE